jgi:hypothetical protein
VEDMADPTGSRGFEADATPPAAARLVVVPRHPGPLRDVADRAPGDDLDLAIEELFGETTDEGPGLFDVALLVTGLGLVAWSIATDARGLPFPLGVLLTILGLALPARSVVRAGQRRSRERTVRRALRGGYALDISDPLTSSLAAAYASLVGRLDEQPERTARPTLEAAHLAMVEVATLLDGGRPTGPAEIAYVERRRKALRDTAAELIRVARHGAVLGSTLDAQALAARTDRAEALARARDELADQSGIGSIGELDAIRAQLRRERTDD